MAMSTGALSSGHLSFGSDPDEPAASRHVVALADPLRQAKLSIDDLDLELRLLEEAAELVVEEEEQKKNQEEEESSSSSEEEEEEPSSSIAQSGDTQEPRAEPQSTPRVQETAGSGPSLPEPRALIQDLSERMEEGLRIEESSGSSGSRGTEREAEGLGHAAGGAVAETAPSRALLDSRPRKNPLLIVRAEEPDSDDEDE